MLLITLSVLLVVIVLFVLAYPIIQQGRGQAPIAASTLREEALADLLAERDAAFQAIRDLQFDHEVGKLSDADLGLYEAQLKQGAAESLRRLDAWEAGVDRSLSQAIERQVRARRAALLQGSRPCPQCGRPVAADDAFCTACGASTRAAPASAESSPAAACPRCGRAVSPDDRFCPKCGQRLAELARN